MQGSVKNRFSGKIPSGGLIFIFGSIFYLIVTEFLTGLKPEHWIVVTGLNLLFWAGKGTRKFVLGFGIFALFGMLYDVMNAFPNYRFHSVDIASLYHLEKALFGLNVNGMRLTPNEFFALRHSVAGDLLSGLFYINWIPVPLAFAVYLYFTNRKLFLHFALTFLFVNLIGFSLYYLHPAAPPWYVHEYGFVLKLCTPGNAAGLARFDELVHLKVFGSIYTKNANVFAAIPSLHCAYPVVVLYYGVKARCGSFNYLLAIFMAGIWFSAVYSGHHYTIDVILGILCAMTGILIYEKILRKQSFYAGFTEGYLRLIT